MLDKDIDVYTKDLIKQLRENNVNLGKVYNIIGSFFGSVEKVPFTKKTLEVFADILAGDPGLTWWSRTVGC